MRPFLAVLLVLFPLMNLAAAEDDKPGYSQSYSIIIKGALAGIENVSEKTSDSGDLLSTSEHEIYVTDRLETKRMTFSTKLILSKKNQDPISYTYKYTTAAGETGDSCEVAIKNGHITRLLTRGTTSNEATSPFQPNTVIVDFNVYHHYDYLVRRYDAKKGGRQLYADFVPVIGNDIPLALTFTGTEKLEFKSGSLAVKSFKVEFVGIWSGSLWVDKDGRLVRLVIPAQDLQVVRTDLLDK